jgi:hypothetical protein
MVVRHVERGETWLTTSLDAVADLSRDKAGIHHNLTGKPQTPPIERGSHLFILDCITNVYLSSGTKL